MSDRTGHPPSMPRYSNHRPKPLPLAAQEQDGLERIMRDCPLFLTWWNVEGERLYADWSKGL